MYNYCRAHSALCIDIGEKRMTLGMGMHEMTCRVSNHADHNFTNCYITKFTEALHGETEKKKWNDVTNDALDINSTGHDRHP